MDACELKELGFVKAGGELEKKQEFKRKMMIAYEHFKVLTPGVLERFEKALKEKTYKEWKNQYGKCFSYDVVKFIPVAKYDKVPPQEVLTAMKEAKKKDCFDSFEIAKTETYSQEAQAPRPDPIVFGRIDGCDDRFFVAQWDNDLKIEDILAHE